MTETGEAQHVIQARREKLSRLRELGIEPYPYSYDPTYTAAQVVDAY